MQLLFSDAVSHGERINVSVQRISLNRSGHQDTLSRAELSIITLEKALEHGIHYIKQKNRSVEEYRTIYLHLSGNII